MSGFRTLRPFSQRSRFSSRIFKLNGRFFAFGNSFSMAESW